jgi:hypothetical protein
MLSRERGVYNAKVSCWRSMQAKTSRDRRRTNPRVDEKLFSEGKGNAVNTARPTLLSAGRRKSNSCYYCWQIFLPQPHILGRRSGRRG